MRLYIIFGNHTDRLSEHLSAKYEIAGADRTLDAAVAAALRLDPRPDVFLILGTALASTMVDQKLNWGAALLKNLTELRRTCPVSRLIIILPETASDSLAREIAQLGVYDIHRVEKVRVEELPGYIDNPRTFADTEMGGEKSEIDAAGKPGEVNLEEKERRSILSRTLDRFRRLRAADAPGMPSDAALLYGSQLFPCSGIEDALSKAKARLPDALLVNENVSLSDVQNLKRNADYAGLAVVMVSPEADPSVFRCGIDDCISDTGRVSLERAVARSRRMRRLWSQANRDGLTGCYRRDFFDLWVESQTIDYSLAVCDLDDFKAVNDRHGHLLGDAVLSEFGRFLTASVRQVDIVARLGGEEFAVAFPGVQPETAAKIVQGVQDKWSHRTVEGVAVTFSCGVAGSAQGNAYDLADKALYAVKATGKNRVLTYQEAVQSEALRAAAHAVKPEALEHEAAYAACHEATQPEIPEVAAYHETVRPEVSEMTVHQETVQSKAPETAAHRETARPEAPEVQPAKTSLAAAPLATGTLARAPLAAVPAETLAGVPRAPMLPARRFSAKVLAVHSPWLEGAGVTTVAVHIAEILNKKHRVALIDADTENPGVAAALGLPLDQMWQYDWRTLDISLAGLLTDGIAPGPLLLVWALDQWRKSSLDPAALRELVAYCQKRPDIDLIVIDAGNDPERDIPGQSLLVVAPDPMLPDVARAWKYFKPRTDSVLVLNRAGGSYDLQSVLHGAEALGLPLGCVLKAGIDAEWKKGLSGFLWQALG